jgi:hypothetical protein
VVCRVQEKESAFINLSITVNEMFAQEILKLLRKDKLRPMFLH